MKNYAEANKPAIFESIKSGVYKGEYIGKMWVIKLTGGTPYMQNGIRMRCSVASPLYGYTKNYTRFKKDFSLFIWTTQSDQENVEQHLDKTSKGLKRSQIMEVLNKIKPMSYVEPSLV